MKMETFSFSTKLPQELVQIDVAKLTVDSRIIVHMNELSKPFLGVNI